MTSGTGILATGSAVSAAGGASGGDRWTVAATDGFGVRLLRFGQDVGIFDSTLATKRGEVTIDYYDLANRIVDTTPALAGVTNGDMLVTSGLTATPVGMYGVPYHHSNAFIGS